MARQWDIGYLRAVAIGLSTGFEGMHSAAYRSHHFAVRWRTVSHYSFELIFAAPLITKILGHVRWRAVAAASKSIQDLILKLEKP
jgi:hypothetical protein